MSWSRFDDGFHDHPKVIRAGNEATGVFTKSVTWSNHNLTDGVIPRETALMLAGGRTELKRVASRLLHAGGDGEIGLWEPHDVGYRIHDFLHYNPSRAEVLAHREKARVRQGRRRSRAESHAMSRDMSRRDIAVSHVPVTQTPYPFPDPEVLASHEKTEKRVPPRAPELAGQSLLRARIPTLADLPMPDEERRHVTYMGCKDPDIAWEHWHAERWKRRDDPRTWCTDWPADFHSWAMNHGRYGCPCDKRNTGPLEDSTGFGAEIIAKMGTRAAAR